MNCIDWLGRYFTENDNGRPIPCEWVRFAAKEAGYDKRDLKEARQGLNVATISTKIKDDLRSFWWLPREEYYQ